MSHGDTQPQKASPWDDPALATLSEWDAAWAATCVKMSTNPWLNDVLPRKFIELVGVGLNAACTNLNPDGTRHHIRAALKAGATREEILFVLKCAAGLSIHSCSLGAPILLEEAQAAGAKPTPAPEASTPACDRMRAVGQWNTAWDPFFQLDPLWTDEFMAMAVGIYGSGVMSAKELELLSIALDASYTHMYAPGTRRHIKAALKAGATVAEIMEVLKLCVVQGVQACNLGVPILAEELAARYLTTPGELITNGEWTMQNPPGRGATIGARPSADTTGPSRRSVKDKLMHGATRFALMFVYLWLVFGLFVLFERIIRGQMGLGYQSQGFAIINAFILAKVMLVAEDLNLDRGLRAQPPVYAALGEAVLFAIIFIAFHVLEKLAVGLLHKSALADSVPAFGGGGFAGLVTVAAIMFVVLIPYFAFRDIGRALGPGEMRRLLFSRPVIAEPTAAPLR